MNLSSWTELLVLTNATSRVQAKAEKEREEADAAARIAWEVKEEFETQEAARLKAKRDLVTFFAENEIYKQYKVEERKKKIEEDFRYMKLYEEILDKQERERTDRLEKLKIWQVR